MAMAKYIDREALVELIDERNRNTCNGALSCLQMKRMAKALPAADVAPVRHGRWDDIPNAYMSVVSKTGAYRGNATTCSVCLDVNPNAFKTNYCPNCGAKMDLEG